MRWLVFFTAFVLALPVSAGVKFYDSPVCFYGNCKSEVRKPEEKKPAVKKVKKDVHYEEVKELFTENGRVPPEPVLKLLAYPTEENARKYVEWAARRSLLLARAMLVVRKAFLERNERLLRRYAPQLSLVFIHSPACPYCVAMSGTLRRLKRRYPELRIQCVSTGDRSLGEDFCDENYTGTTGGAIAEGFGATGYPLVVVRRGGAVVDRITGSMTYETFLGRLVFDLMQLEGKR